MRKGSVVKNNGCTHGQLVHRESKLSGHTESELVGRLPTSVSLRIRREPNWAMTTGRSPHKKISPIRPKSTSAGFAPKTTFEEGMLPQHLTLWTSPLHDHELATRETPPASFAKHFLSQPGDVSNGCEDHVPHRLGRHQQQAMMLSGIVATPNGGIAARRQSGPDPLHHHRRVAQREQLMRKPCHFQSLEV